MLKILLPKGRLQAGVIALLARVGLVLTFKDRRDYRPQCNDSTVQVKVVNPRSVPYLLAKGDYDVGFCGLDIFEESQAIDTQGVIACVDLGLNRVDVVIATHPVNLHVLDQPPQRPLVVATEYAVIARDWACSRMLEVQVIYTFGCTEAWVPDDADIIVDITETGQTLKANGLIVLEQLKASTTWLVSSERAMFENQQAMWLIHAIRAAVQGVLGQE